MQILVAEDDGVVQLFARRVLERLGHRVTVVGNGKDAVDAIHKSRYDLVLMDIQMPVMNGLEATIAIRQSDHLTGIHTPIIAFTSFDESDQFLIAGMDGYLGKPVSAESLLRAVQAVAARFPKT
jgi:CheY-like chemotaxis protein